MFSFNLAGMDFPDTSTDLTFNATSTTQTVMVSILNDVVPEDMLEYFSLILTSTDTAVTLNPVIANVTIIDDMDSKYHLTQVCSELFAYTNAVQYIYCILYCVCIRYIFSSSAVVTIGFDPVSYSVLEEDASSVNVTVSVLNGTLARNIVVTLSTVSGGTAIGKLYTANHLALL